MLLRDKKTGLWIRPGTWDREVVREQRCYAPMSMAEGEVVLDLGGHIGSFACLACPQESGVTSYEPDPENFKVLVKQYEAGLGPDEWNFVEAAVTPMSGTAELFINSKKNKGSHTLRPTRGRDSLTVDTVAFSTVLRYRDFTAIKCDIEGAEYDLDWSLVQDSDVRVIAMELHMQPPGWRDRAGLLWGSFEDMGWTTVVAPKVTGGHWHSLMIVRR